MSFNVEAEIKKFAGSREEQFRQLITLVRQAEDIDILRTVFDYILNDTNTQTQVIQRVLFNHLGREIQQLDFQAHHQIATYVLDALKARSQTYEKEIAPIAEALGDAFYMRGQFQESNDVYRLVNVDSVAFVEDPEFRALLLIKRAQCSLALNRDGPADSDISKAGKIISDTNVDRKNPTLALRYKVCIAKLRDRQGQFLVAVRYYNGLSQSELMGNKEEPLRAACICAILSQAGPLRSKWLNTLYKDERCQKFDRIKTTIFPVLEQMAMEKIVRKADLTDFIEELEEHHLCQAADRSTVFDRALMDHNLFSASKLYMNISFNELGALLGIKPEEAEITAAKMISEKRLPGAIIDQVDGIIIFPHQKENLLVWDQHVEATCSTLNTVVESIASKFPALYS